MFIPMVSSFHPMLLPTTLMQLPRRRKRLTGKDFIKSPILIMLFQHSDMRQEGRIVKIFCPIRTGMDAALTLDADTRYLIRLSKVNRAHGTQAGAEAAGYAFFHIRLGNGL